MGYCVGGTDLTAMHLAIENHSPDIGPWLGRALVRTGPGLDGPWLGQALVRTGPG